MVAVVTYVFKVNSTILLYYTYLYAPPLSTKLVVDGIIIMNDNNNN